jgi:flagellar biosynthesis/type III secretory pathway protein FliH
VTRDVTVPRFLAPAELGTSTRSPAVPAPIRWPEIVALEAEPKVRDAHAEITRTLVEAAGQDQGRERGRAEGLAETRALRAELTDLCEALRSHRRESLADLGHAAVDAAVVIVEAWLEASDGDRCARLAPVVARWVREVGDVAAVVQVAPGDVSAMREVVGDLPLEVYADHTLDPGDVRLRGDRMAIELRWRERLAELRAELITMMSTGDKERPT